MIGFLLRRFAWSVLVVWFVVTTTFAMLFWIPADPARTLVGPHGDEATLKRVRKQYCLDKGFIGQYSCFVGRMVRGDLGTSFRTHRKVTEVLSDKIWPTAQLAIAAIFLQLIIAIPLGVVAAMKRNQAADYAANVAALIGQSAPTFFIAPLFMYFLGFRLGWFPVSGYGNPGWDRMHHLILPAMTLAVVGIAYYTRLVRSEMIEVLQEDYIRTARAKGLPRWKVIGKHGLRNGLAPVITLMGLDLGILMGGAVVTEAIFAWPGLGREVLQAVLEFDIPMVLGVVVFTAIAIVAANLVVDVLYAIIDPRVRLE